MERVRIPEIFSNGLKEAVVVGREWKRLLSRDARKYAKITTAINILSATRIAPAFAPAYFFCRAVDDFADGDRDLPSEHGDYFQFSRTLIDLIDGNREPTDDVDFLLSQVIQRLGSNTSNGIDVKTELKAFMKAMEIENERRMNNGLLTREQLMDLYRDSFSSPQNIAFAALGSTASSEVVSQLGLLQGSFYAIRDLRDELPRGIINIPSEVIERSDLEHGDLCDPDIVLENPSIQEWIKASLAECQEWISELRAVDLDFQARVITGFLVNPIDTAIKTRLTLMQ